MIPILVGFLRKVDNEIFRKAGFHFKEITFEKIVDYLYRPTDSSSLGFSRMLFGFLMMIDGCEERGGAELDIRWGDPHACHFPLLPIPLVKLPYMTLLYAIMWIGALGIALGYHFRRSALMFAIPYWYILLMDKSYWNNHSYLFGLLAVLLSGTQANNYLSVDAYNNPSMRGKPVPYWNYFIIKYQLFILYFIAGLKKSGKEWLSGYAMSSLSQHWVFDPFKLLLSTDSIDYFIVHWFAFVFDLTVCFWMMYSPTRIVAMVFCSLFHLMNSRLFSIGMFPWVCLATMPLFCSPHWPKNILKLISRLKSKTYKVFTRKHVVTSEKMKTQSDVDSRNTDVDCDEIRKHDNYNDNSIEDNMRKDDSNDQTNNKKANNKCSSKRQSDSVTRGDVKSKNNVSWKRSFVVCLLFTHMGIQAFLPYSHFITKGFNNWTNGLYGYSWDMMVHTWDTILVLVKVVDNESKFEMFLDPEAWVPNDRWSKHGDMMYQYAHCLKKNLAESIDTKSLSENINKFTNKKRLKDEEKYSLFEEENEERISQITSKNISIYVDVWCSLNSRFQQRMFNPNVDLLKVRWSPFKKVEWLMPLFADLSDWRREMSDIQAHVYSWNNFSDVLFVADFPGLYLENYISPDLTNVSLTVLDGHVFYETFVKKKHTQESRIPGKTKAVHLAKGESISINPGVFHKVHTVGTSPACYMYTFMNATFREMGEDQRWINKIESKFKTKPKLPIRQELVTKIENILLFLQHVGNALLNIIYGVPMILRIPLR